MESSLPGLLAGSWRSPSDNWSVITRFTILFCVFFGAAGPFAPELRAGDADSGGARALAGVEQTAAGSAVPVEKLSVNFFFSEPLSSRWSTWGDLRLSSLPRAISSTLVSLPADVLQAAAAVPVHELVRSGEFLGGASYRVSGGAGSWAALQAIASAGASVPLASAQNRFLRQYYAGFRVLSRQRTHMVDVTAGQNEVVSPGGITVRFDGAYGLPVRGGGFLYLFGTAVLRASPRVSRSDPGSDIYRIGVGLDMVQVLKALRLN